MPRYPRLFLPHMPLHIVQRGHDRQPTFVDSADYQHYLDNLIEMKQELEIQVFGYCLMTNHVHLLVAPGQECSNISRMMRVLAARQTRYVNKIEHRTGTLWEGRFKASLIDSDNYLLACYRYVDLNPVRASMVQVPEDYQWSSYRQHISQRDDDWLDRSDLYTRLGASQSQRAANYRTFVRNGTHERELSKIRAAVQRNQITGTDRFRVQLEQRIGRRISARAQGRPRQKK